MIIPVSPLPFAPEPIASLRARFPGALAAVFDCASIEADPSVPRPGQVRANTFDFEDGLRMIVSRDDLGRSLGGVHLHASASLEEGSPLEAEMMRIYRARGIDGVRAAFRSAVEARYEEIAGRPMPPFKAWSDWKGVPHWFGPEGDPR